MNQTIRLCVYGVIIAVLFYACSTSCLMKTLNDAQKIQAHKQYFINKPLKILLSQIKPKIKMVSANPGWVERAGYFIFRFVDSVDQQKYNRKEVLALNIRVSVKEPFEWDFQKRGAQGKLFIWTDEDVEKYGNLTIIYLNVSGEILND